MMAAHRVPPQMMGIMRIMLGVLGMWRRRVEFLCEIIEATTKEPIRAEQLVKGGCIHFEDYNLDIQ